MKMMNKLYSKLIQKAINKSNNKKSFNKIKLIILNNNNLQNIQEKNHLMYIE